jgi:hypothetical protein
MTVLWLGSDPIPDQWERFAGPRSHQTDEAHGNKPPYND